MPWYKKMLLWGMIALGAYWLFTAPASIGKVVHGILGWLPQAADSIIRFANTVIG
jgi:hypothetical protein